MKIGKNSISHTGVMNDASQNTQEEILFKVNILDERHFIIRSFRQFPIKLTTEENATAKDLYLSNDSLVHLTFDSDVLLDLNPLSFMISRRQNKTIDRPYKESLLNALDTIPSNLNTQLNSQNSIEVWKENTPRVKLAVSIIDEIDKNYRINGDLDCCDRDTLREKESKCEFYTPNKKRKMRFRKSLSKKKQNAIGFAYDQGLCLTDNKTHEISRDRIKDIKVRHNISDENTQKNSLNTVDKTNGLQESLPSVTKPIVSQETQKNIFRILLPEKPMNAEELEQGYERLIIEQKRPKIIITQDHNIIIPKSLLSKDDKIQLSLTRTKSLPQNKCSICLDEMANPARISPCLHEYCKECIDQWAKSSTSCPLCKKDFKQIIYNGNSGRKKIRKRKKFKADEEEVEEWYNNCLEYCMICEGTQETFLMLVCDQCNYNVCHTYCDNLDIIPDGEWTCAECRGDRPKVDRPRTIGERRVQNVRRRRRRSRRSRRLAYEGLNGLRTRSRNRRLDGGLGIGRRTERRIRSKRVSTVVNRGNIRRIRSRR